MRTELEKFLLKALLAEQTEELKAERFDLPNLSFRKVGQKVLIRTVTHYYTGEIVAVLPDGLQLKDAAWIPDTGRFGEALKSGKFAEVEPYPGLVEIYTGGSVDICPWPHPLPKEAKP